MHKHPVYDTDTHFIIDPITRVVSNPESKKTILMQNDHNSERFSFEINRYVEGHDLTLCDKVEVHYANVDSNKKNKSLGVYEVTDVELIEDKDDTLVFTWLVSENATLYAGTLSFLILFACTENGKDVYRWNSGINTSISISKGMNNGESISETYPDILTQWKDELYAAVYGFNTIKVGPTEPETFPYIWIDTSGFYETDDTRIGILTIKDAEGLKKQIYPVTKLAATDAANLLEELAKQEELLNQIIETQTAQSDSLTLIIDNYIIAVNGKNANDENAVIIYATDIPMDSNNDTSVATELDKKAVTALYTGTFVSSGWSSSAPYVQTITVEGITSADWPIADVSFENVTSSDDGISLTEAWAMVNRIETGEGTLTAYCYEDTPTVDIPVIIKVVR